MLEISVLKHTMNRGLAKILLSNLLKNAIVHGQKQSNIEILISENSFRISNSSNQASLDSDKVFSRFQKNSGSKNSNGIGLAIAQTIAKKYNFQLKYFYSDKHNFQLNFPK